MHLTTTDFNLLNLACSIRVFLKDILCFHIAFLTLRFLSTQSSIHALPGLQY
jgi:hypothetical protein